ncbi:hypothetical protein AAVH_37076 [Aphelenchoides avenae]|nr:hypothetical protein AAVH_37076 [Aphelenchus avenae]
MKLPGSDDEIPDDITDIKVSPSIPLASTHHLHPANSLPHPLPNPALYPGLNGDAFLPNDAQFRQPTFDFMASAGHHMPAMGNGMYPYFNGASWHPSAPYQASTQYLEISKMHCGR